MKDTHADLMPFREGGDLDAQGWRLPGPGGGCAPAGRRIAPGLKRTVLFLINGLGLGNSTRCAAVMAHLTALDCEIHVKTSGNGIRFLKSVPSLASVTETASFAYGKTGSRISGWQTWKSARAIASAYRAKDRDLDGWLKVHRPDLAVIDSEYAVSGLRRRGIPILAINNSEVVVSKYLSGKAAPMSVRSHFWGIEFADYLFHRTFCHGVLSPAPQREQTRHRRFHRIGLIVRPAVQALADDMRSRPMPAPREVRRALFMLSGSIHASHVNLTGRDWPFAVDVVGREGPSAGQITYHGKLMNNIDLLRQADVLVINGGYSAVSEAMALNKPAFVIPVPGHAEQFVNARLMEEMGRGVVTDESRIVNHLLACWRENRWIGMGSVQEAVEYHGAEEAANIIMEFRCT